MIAINEKILEIEKTVTNSNKLLQNTENEINKLLDKINTIKKPIENLHFLFEELYEFMYDNFNEYGEEFYAKLDELKKIISQTNKLIGLYKKHSLYSGFKNSLKNLYYAVDNVKEIANDLNYKFSENKERDEIIKLLSELQ